MADLVEPREPPALRGDGRLRRAMPSVARYIFPGPAPFGGHVDGDERTAPP